MKQNGRRRPRVRRLVISSGTVAIWLTVALPGLAQTNAFPEFRVETARQYLQTVSQGVPTETGTNAETYFLQARLQSQLGRQEEAERLALEGLRLEPNRADMEVFLADLFIHQDRLREATQRLRRATQLEPKIKGGYRRLGMVLDRLGDRSGAQDAFTRAIGLLPEDATAYLLLGRLLLEQGETPRAIEQLERACELDPQLANAYYALVSFVAGTNDALSAVFSGHLHKSAIKQRSHNGLVALQT